MSAASGFTILLAIDLRGGRVVRLRQGDFAQETAYSEDPVAVAREFAGLGAEWLHVVDLDAARTGVRSNTSVIESLVEAIGDRLRVEVAGGLREEEAVAAVLASGAARAVVGTAALRDPGFAGRLVAAHGADRIVAALDVRGGRAVGHGWAPGAAGVDATEVLRRLADAGVTTFEVTAIDRDGLLGGPDLRLYEGLVRMGRGAIVASGGIASVEDLRAVQGIGCTGAIVGRAIYEGRIRLADAIAFGRAAGGG